MLKFIIKTFLTSILCFNICCFASYEQLKECDKNYKEQLLALGADDTKLLVSNSVLSNSFLKVVEAWARLPVGLSNNSAAYMKIYNETDNDVVIVGVYAPDVANSVEMRNSFIDVKGISRAVPVNKIVIPAHSEIELKPNSIHIGLFRLKKRFSVGENFDIYFKYDSNIQEKFTVTIRS